MLPLLIALIAAIVIVVWIVYRARTAHRVLMETFRAEDESMRPDITEEDKYLYFLIIDMYQKNLRREPSEDELETHFSNVKHKKEKMADVYEHIVDSDEFKRLQNPADTDDKMPVTAPSQSTKDFEVVKRILEELIPNTKIYYERNNRLYVDFIVAKYVAFDRDVDRLRAYIMGTPEYAEAHPAKKAPPQAPKANTENNEKERKSAVLNVSQKSVYEFDRPHQGQTTASRKACDDLFPETHTLSDVRDKREKDRMRFACEQSNTYDNVDTAMRLLPDQQWSVPQKRAPVCTSKNKCDVGETFSQTALIGTVLDDAENDRILPTFSYEEEEI